MADRSVPGVMRWVGLALFLATGFLYAVSGLVAPLWGLAVLWVIWAALAVLFIRWWRGNPWKVLAIPFMAASAWAIVLYLGDTLFGWTA